MKDVQRRLIAVVGLIFIPLIIIALPLSILSEYLIGLTMFFGAAITVFLGLFIFSFKNIRESSAFGFVVFGLIIFFFIISAGIIYYQVSQESDELTHDSLITTAKIVDGKIFRSKRNYSAEVKIEFITADGKKVQASEIVTEKEFRRHYVGEEIKIRYSRSTPNVINIIEDR